VIGTEARQLYILSPANAKLLVTLTLPDVPCILACEGEYTTEYRVIIGFRNGSIGICRDGKFLPNIITTATGLVGLTILNKKIYVVRMDKVFQCYTIKGKCLFSLELPSFAVAFCPMVMSQAKQFKGLLVGLDTGEVLVFNHKSTVSQIKIPVWLRVRVRVCVCVCLCLFLYSKSPFGCVCVFVYGGG
jgi:Bardet-Biedl syndrome 1 protein